MKKIIAFIVVFALVLALVPAVVFAATNLAALPAGTTFTLDDDYNATAALSVTGDYTIDLNGHTLSLGATTLTVSGGAVLNIIDSSEAKTGKINSTGTAISISNGTVNANGGVITGGSLGVYVLGNGTANSSILNVNGAVIQATWWGVYVSSLGGVVNVISGTVQGTNVSSAGISGNGSTGLGGTVINISGGAVKGGEGGTGTADGQGVGIYHPQSGTLTISGGTISGDMAISVKSGTVKISGGTLKATGDYVDPAKANGNGTEDTGSALSLTSNPAYTGDINVEITGGTFTSAKGNAIYEGVATKLVGGVETPVATTEQLKVKSLSITGGDFVASTDGKKAIDINNVATVAPSITGGTFTDTAAEMIEAGLLKTGTPLYEIKLADGTVAYTFTNPNPKTGDITIYVAIGSLLVLCALFVVLKRERNAA